MKPDELRRLLNFEPGNIPRSDYELNPDSLRDDSVLTHAAVLIPIISRPDAASILLTQRAAALRRHGGQISFPGGKIDPEDEDDIAAALREAEEEIQVPRSAIEIIGRLSPYRTVTGFLIHPVVGLLDSKQSIEASRAEVEDVFEVPLSFVIDPANIQRHSTLYEGVERHYFAIPHGNRYIWGATAGILVQLALQLGSKVHG